MLDERTLLYWIVVWNNGTLVNVSSASLIQICICTVYLRGDVCCTPIRVVKYLEFLPLLKNENAGISSWETMSTDKTSFSGWIWQEHTWFLMSPSSVIRADIARFSWSPMHCMAAAALLLWRSISTQFKDIEPSSSGWMDMKELKDTLAASNSIPNARKRVTAIICDSAKDAMFSV